MLHSDNTGGSDSREAKAAIPVEAVKEEWRLLWRDRIDDKVRAEGIANQHYPLLFVDRGTVIVATRDFKPPNLKEILSQHEVQNLERVISPPPAVGGWGKFARTVLNKQRRSRRRQLSIRASGRVREKRLPRKKGGRGWLHARLDW